MNRLLIANLDYEDELARAAGLSVAPLRPEVIQRLAALAEPMRALGEPADELWTLESGPLPAAADRVLAWGESRAVAALRPGPCAPDVPLDDWRAALWRLWPPAEVAARCNHRGFAFELAGRLGTALPGARLIGAVGELEDHLRAGGGAAGAGVWQARAPYSASGRHRLRHRGPPDAPAISRLERLLAAGPLLFEPWVDRIADVGVVGIVAGPGRKRLFAPHRLDNDAAGVYRAVGIDQPPELQAAERERVDETAHAVADALAAAGYRGPFGVDAFVWRDPAGARRLQPMSEINARLTFGLVARAAATAGATAGSRSG